MRSQLDLTIEFWEDKLFHDQFLLSPSTTFLIKDTVKNLKELREIKKKEEEPSATAPIG